MLLKSPYPYFGGKSAITTRVWQLLGDCRNYCEPFFGSGAVLLRRPDFDAQRHIETINDKDGMVTNAWRAIQQAPEAVATWADFPVHECQLHAIHAWLVGKKASLQQQLEGDPDWYDAQIAGRWIFGMSCWIGSEFCSGNGPWQVVDGQLVRLGTPGQGVQRQLVHLGDAGRGVQRHRVHLGNAGRGVQRQRVHLGSGGNGNGVNSVGRAETTGLRAWMQALSQRLRRVRVCCGDWSRVMGPSVLWKHGLTGVYLDPPYSGETGRAENLYTVEDLQVAHAVRDWCVEHGSNRLLRIVLSGYETEHDELLVHGWRKEGWTATGGFGNQRQQGMNENRHREVLWISPHCVEREREQPTLFPL